MEAQEAQKSFWSNIDTYFTPISKKIPEIFEENTLYLNSPVPFCEDNSSTILTEIFTSISELNECVKNNNEYKKKLKNIINNLNEGDDKGVDTIDSSDMFTYYLNVARWQSLRLTLQHGIRDVTYVSDAEHKLLVSQNEDEEIETCVCSVCFDGDSTSSNPIVFCEHCNICVHKCCYGIPKVPLGDWFCDVCQSLSNTLPRKRKQDGLAYEHQCALCPIQGGALQQASNHRWIHTTCALLLPGSVIESPTTMRPIHIDKALEDLEDQSELCYICNLASGACVRCSHPRCTTYFHAMCGWYHGIYMKAISENEECVLLAYCERHTPKISFPRDQLQQKEMRNRGRQEQIDRLHKGQIRRLLDEDHYEVGRCCICFETEEGNKQEGPILHCKKCKIDVHAGCYGVNMRRSGGVPVPRRWYCRRCESKHWQKLSCCLCPRKGGALKPTNDGKWAHVACAIWIPEVTFQNTQICEPIVGCNIIPNYRFQAECYLCHRTEGACIPCSRQCGLWFHPLCGLLSGSYMRVQQDPDNIINIILTVYCKKHTPILQTRSIEVPQTYHNMLQLRRDLDRVRSLVDLYKRRERIRKNLLTCSVSLFDETCEFLDNTHKKCMFENVLQCQIQELYYSQKLAREIREEDETIVEEKRIFSLLKS